MLRVRSGVDQNADPCPAPFGRPPPGSGDLEPDQTHYREGEPNLHDQGQPPGRG